MGANKISLETLIFSAETASDAVSTGQAFVKAIILLESSALEITYIGLPVNFDPFAAVVEFRAAIFRVLQNRFASQRFVVFNRVFTVANS